MAKRRRKKRKAKTNLSKQNPGNKVVQEELQTKPKKFFQRYGFWGAVTLVLTIVMAWLTLTPKISVTPQNELIPVPLAFTFYVKNEGLLSVKDVHFSSHVRLMEGERFHAQDMRMNQTPPMDIPELRPGETSTMYTSFGFPIFHRIDYTDIIIKVAYRPPLFFWIYDTMKTRYVGRRLADGSRIFWTQTALSETLHAKR